ncbi:MAG: hypothetical protein K9J17_03440 [Flavobacteriales bacterium]|nr:hypothetical protein [Flavobacteriales bacterium]
MKNSISILSVAILIASGFTSCTKIEENQAPVVTIISPSATNNPYMSGMPITIHVEATDDVGLHEIVVTVVREHDSVEVYSHYDHSHEASYSFEVDTMFTTTTHSDFTLTVTASDHEEEETVATETFHMHPM